MILEIDAWYYYQLSQPSVRLKLKQFHPSLFRVFTLNQGGSIWWGLAGYRDVDMMMTSKSWLNMSRPKSWHLLVEWHGSFTVIERRLLEFARYLTWSSVSTDHAQLHAVVGGRPVALGTAGRRNPGGGGVRRTGGIRGGELGGRRTCAEVQSATWVHFQGRLTVKLPVAGRPHQLESWLDGDLWFRRMRISCGRPWAGFDCQTEVPRLLQFSELLMPFSSVAKSRKSHYNSYERWHCLVKSSQSLCINDDNKTAKPF